MAERFCLVLLSLSGRAWTSLDAETNRSASAISRVAVAHYNLLGQSPFPVRGKLISVYYFLYNLKQLYYIAIVQTLLDFDERSCCILVPHPSTRRPDRQRSPF